MPGPGMEGVKLFIYPVSIQMPKSSSDAPVPLLIRIPWGSPVTGLRIRVELTRNRTSKEKKSGSTCERQAAS